jgi:glycosyltransferase involved in cell wall biosynthesis
VTAPGASSLTVLILTFNEARHIERAIASVRDVATRIVVVDSGSTDETRNLAAAAGADVFQNPWSNHSRQINWALTNTAIDTCWTFRLDADEIVLPELAASLAPLGSPPTEIMGYTVNRRIHFLGRWLRHGGLYPVRTLRLFRTGYGSCEERWMDEQILVQGPVGHLDADLADINLGNIGWWTAKHNDYATREAIEELLGDRALARDATADSALEPRARFRRWVKLRLYRGLPFGLRALLPFVYRYIVRLGFLDGWQGLSFAVLQAFWFRFLTDVKIREIGALAAERNQSLSQVIETEYGIRISGTAESTACAGSM